MNALASNTNDKETPNEEQGPEEPGPSLGLRTSSVLGFRSSFARRGPGRTASLRSSFALRESRGEGLYWSNLKLDLVKGGHVVKNIIRGEWGEALPFETTAIMGASGSGKTSLFNALSGRTSSNLILDGEIRFGKTIIDNKNRDIYKKRLAFVAQEDVLNESSTPREAIRFSARLRLPREVTNEAIDELVCDYLANLGLDGCADSEIGGVARKGISGGEKKRTSIGTELVTDPSVVLLDEPTSGLDSFAAKNLMGLLDKVARAGNTVLFTIHQPSSRIFFAFDKLILLDAGRLMHIGRVSDIVRDFESRGYPVEPNFNPADWVMEVAHDNSEEELGDKGFFPEDDRVLPKPSSVPLKEVSGGRSCFSQTSLLFQRELIGLKRHPSTLIIGLVMSALCGVFGGILFWDIGSQSRQDPTVIQAQSGGLVTALFMSMMNQSMIVLLIFAVERPLFLKEYMTDHYTVVPYVLAHFGTEVLQTVVMLLVQSVVFYFMISFQMSFAMFYVLNILVALNASAAASFVGASVSDPVTASSLFPVVITPQFYFSGVLVAIPLIPSAVRWLQYICSLRWGMALALLYEYEDCSPTEEEYCDAFLEAQDVNPDDRWWYWILLVSLFAAFKIASVIMLQLVAAKYRG